jgi:hypothetical protein
MSHEQIGKKEILEKFGDNFFGLGKSLRRPSGQLRL